MIQKMQKRLTLLFTAATGVILTLALLLAFFYQSRTKLRQNDTLFQNYLLDFTHRIESGTGFSDDWLAKTEADAKLIIHIEDNGNPLFFSGSWNPPTERETLIDLARAYAANEGVSTKVRPYSASLAKSSVFPVKGRHHDSYQAAVLVLSVPEGFRSLVLLSDTTWIYRDFLFQTVFFVILELFGLFALFLVSKSVVRKATLPIEIYHQKQNEFIAAASHELRSPLAVMQTSASAILSMPSEAEKMAKIIKNECVRSGNLIKNLLFLTSEEQFVQEMHPVEIDALLLRLFETYEPLCASKGIKLYFSLPEKLLPCVWGNEEWIYEILSILLDNAIAHGCTKEKPAIRLCAEMQAKKLSVLVIDHGVGIADTEKEKIFDRFYRADQSRSSKDHAGLGLSIAAMLAEKMPLTLSLSDTPGGGSTFCITFRRLSA